MAQTPINNNTAVQPLDCEFRKFYFKSANGSSKIYYINEQDFSQSSLIKGMPDPFNCTKDNPFIFEEIKQDSCIINQAEHIEFIGEYFALWENNYEASIYCNNEVIQTSIPEQLLHEKDLLLITSYIEQQKNKLSHEQLQQLELNRLAYNHWRIDVLNPLLCTIDGMFDIKGLCNKIYAYIATIIWECSIREYNEEQDDPYFVALQKDARTKWREDNKYKCEIIGPLDKTN